MSLAVISLSPILARISLIHMQRALAQYATLSFTCHLKWWEGMHSEQCRMSRSQDGKSRSGLTLLVTRKLHLPPHRYAFAVTLIHIRSRPPPRLTAGLFHRVRHSREAFSTGSQKTIRCHREQLNMMLRMASDSRSAI